MSITAILLLVAVILWGIKAFGVVLGKVDLTAAGLFFAGLAFLIPLL